MVVRGSGRKSYVSAMCWELRRSSQMRIWRDRSASKVLAMQPWASEFGSQHLHEKLDIVSCMPVTYAHNPSIVWGRDKRVLKLSGHWSSRLRERPCLIGISQRVIEDIQYLPLAFMCADRHVYLHTQIPNQRTHTQKFQGDI